MGCVPTLERGNDKIKLPAQTIIPGPSPGGGRGWIACHALAEDAILVTNNTGEFERVGGLRLENWADEA